NLPASILLTIHLPMHSRSSLDEILTRAGPLPACFAKDGDILRKSHIYIAPPDRHLVVDGDRISLGEGPRENNARPAIDPMARSAAVWCGSRTVGVVLTGTLGDGASGLWTIRQSGGITVVQDPKDAAYSEMPLTALNRAKPDHIAQLKDMPALLTSLAHEPAGKTKALPRSAHYEVEVARTGRGDMALDDNLRRALASAVRALEERTALARKLYHQAKNSGHRLLAETWAAKMNASPRSSAIRRAVWTVLPRRPIWVNRARRNNGPFA